MSDAGPNNNKRKDPVYLNVLFGIRLGLTCKIAVLAQFSLRWTFSVVRKTGFINGCFWVNRQPPVWFICIPNLTEQRWHGEAVMPVTCLHRQWLLITMNDACAACFSHQAFYVTSLRPALVASPLPVNRTPMQGSECWARPVRSGSPVMLLTDSPCPLSSIVRSLQWEAINNCRFHQEKPEVIGQLVTIVQMCPSRKWFH